MSGQKAGDMLSLFFGVAISLRKSLFTSPIVGVALGIELRTSHIINILPTTILTAMLNLQISSVEWK